METLQSIMKNIQWSKIFAEEVRRLANEIMTTEKRFLTGNLERVSGALSELTTRKERLLELYLEGGIERADYMEVKNEIEKKATEEEAILENHKRGDAVFKQKMEELIEGFTHWSKTFLKSKGAARGAILRRLAARVTINRESDIQIEFKQPFAMFISDEIQKAGILDDSELVRKHPVMCELLESNQ